MRERCRSVVIQNLFSTSAQGLLILYFYLSRLCSSYLFFVVCGCLYRSNSWTSMINNLIWNLKIVQCVSSNSSLLRQAKSIFCFSWVTVPCKDSKRVHDPISERSFVTIPRSSIFGSLINTELLIKGRSTFPLIQGNCELALTP